MALILGREIVAEALRSGDARPYLDAGFGLDFMRDAMHPAWASVFSGQDIDAWLLILRHQEKFGRVPDPGVFRASFPEGTYDLPRSRSTAGELTALACDAVAAYETEVGNTEAGRWIDAGEPVTAAEIMLATARKVLSARTRGAVRRAWDSPVYDLRERLAVIVRRGPGTGIPALDGQFSGFQDGQLITYLGRAKAGKTSFLIASAFTAWTGRTPLPGLARSAVEPCRVMFVTTEIPEEGIRDRLTAYGAGVNPSPFLASTEDHRASPEQEKRLLEFWENHVAPEAASEFCVIQPTGKYGVAEIETDAESCEPGIIYVDGFYFLTDPATGRMGAHWEAHDNLARGLKALAMRLDIPVVVTHQVREKQLGSAGGGIDDAAMMGGTGLRMASDLVLGIDKGKDGIVTVNCTASRNEYLKAVRGEWNWDTYRFEADENWDPEAAGD